MSDSFEKGESRSGKCGATKTCTYSIGYNPGLNPGSEEEGDDTILHIDYLGDYR